MKMSKRKMLGRWIAILLIIAMLPVIPIHSAAASADADVVGSTSHGLSFERADYSPNTRPASSFITKDDLATSDYDDDDIVRVSIVLEDEATLDAGYQADSVAENAELVSYRDNLRLKQKRLESVIQRDILAGDELDVVWNLTLAANAISANIPFGAIGDIMQMDGVKGVFIETEHTPEKTIVESPTVPNMGTSGTQIGSSAAWLAGYTGAGRRIAIIDTGIDTDHQSFDGGALEYSLKEQGLKVDLVDASDLEKVFRSLNIGSRVADASNLYHSSKVPFGYNYRDFNFNVTHTLDMQTEHGSHVAGIAAANAYIPNGNGGYVAASDTVKVKGVAPDAQLFIMKVFGESGAAYDSDFFAAVEDAITLECDVANLSLGTVSPGFGYSNYYNDLLASLTSKGLVMTTSAGNNAAWVEESNQDLPYLYDDDISFHTGGSPGSYAQTLTTASVNNSGSTGMFLQIGDAMFAFSETADTYGEDPISSIAGNHKFIYIDAYGTEEEFEAIEDVLEGNIAVCNRGGGISFYLKANAAVEHGAAAVIIINNAADLSFMDLSDYAYMNPVVGVSLTSREYFMTNWTALDSDVVDGYYTGTITISKTAGSFQNNNKFYDISWFSSWGVPQTLTLKPEITAPGGSIYSVNGKHLGYQNSLPTMLGGHDQYETMSGTSMASPQTAGMIALLSQYLDENGIDDAEGISKAALAQSLLMSTAVPMFEDYKTITNSAGLSSYYYPVIRQGAGLANVGNAVRAMSYIMMNKDATAAYADGKVKAEFGANKEGKYSYSFTINNLNGKANQYTLSTDLFTQDIAEYEGERYLDTWTVPLYADIVYTVDGEEFIPRSAVTADVNGDGVTDAEDAKAILAYVVETVDGSKLDLKAADVDGDGKITTYDAYLILSNLETTSFTVPADKSVTVSVEIVITSDLSAYKNGAYVQGYTFVKPLGNEDGELDVTHSIPLFGYYGSWSDPSMFDQGSYAENLYDEDARTPYVAPNEQYNYLSYTDSKSGNTYIHTGNPYGIEDSYPEGKLAIRGTDTLYRYNFTMIRNAATIALVVIDADTNNVIYAGAPQSYGSINIGAYFNTNTYDWYNTSTTLSINQKLANLGVKEGQTVKVGFVAVPEYYLTEEILAPKQNEGAFIVTVNELKSIIPELGDGAFMTTTLTVDNTPPTLEAAVKNDEDGSITVTAKDNANVAYIAVLSRNGAKLYADVLGPAAKADRSVEYTFDVGDAGIGSQCLVMVGDYAGNETSYVVNYGGEDPDYSGKMYVFAQSHASRNGMAQVPELAGRWLEVDPENLTWEYDSRTMNTQGYTGLLPFSDSNGIVSAADYADGYVFSIIGTKLYVSELETLLDPLELVDLAIYGVPSVADMAYNFTDGMLYLVDAAPITSARPNQIWRVNPLTGYAEVVYTIPTITGLTSNTSRKIHSIAISNDGTFYATTTLTATSVPARLIKWTNEDVQDGVATVKLVGNVRAWFSVYDTYGVLAYDHTNDELYLASNYQNIISNEKAADNGYYTPDPNNSLWKIDTNTAAATQVNTIYGDKDQRNGRLYFGSSGLFIVPGKDIHGNADFAPTKKVMTLELSETSVDLLVTGSVNLEYVITPWTLEDKTVSWSSSNEQVATVDEKGVVTALTTGHATITATANADGKTATCEINVGKLPSIDMSAFIYGADGSTYWSDYNTSNTENWEPITGVPSSRYFYAGALLDDALYVHDGDIMYKVDADTFEATMLGLCDFPFADVAALPSVAPFGEFSYIFPVTYGAKQFLLLGSEDMNLTNRGNGWDMTDEFGNDPMAVITYAYTEAASPATEGYDADHVYMMTESGELYHYRFYMNVYMESEYVGKVKGVDLTNVSAVDGATSASLAYDKETNYLILTSFIQGIDEEAKMQLIDLDSLRVVATTGFGEGVWPVVANYQYERLSDLTLKLDTYEVNTYENVTRTVTATVKVFKDNDGVTWESRDPSIATVQDGVITGVSEGDTVITVKTIETNSKGEHVTATINVHVTGRNQLDTNATIDAQLDDGTWVRIPLANPASAVRVGNSPVMSAGGRGDDYYIYGSNAKFEAVYASVYKIDPANFSVVDSYNYHADWVAPVDLTYAPALKQVVNGKEYTAFGQPMFIPYDSVYWNSEIGDESHGRGMYMFLGFGSGSLAGTVDLTMITNTGDFASALIYGYTFDTESLFGPQADNVFKQSELFYVMNADTLYSVIWTPYVDMEDGKLTYRYYTSKVRDLNHRFEDDIRLSMEKVDLDGDGEVDGYVLAYGGDNEADLFYMATDTYDVQYIGTVPNATGISSLCFPQSDGADKLTMSIDPAAIDISSLVEVKGDIIDLDAVIEETADKFNPVYTANIIEKTMETEVETNDVDAPATTADDEDQNITIEVKAEDATNGLYTVDYDADALKLVSVNSGLPYIVYNDQTDGTVKIAFASETAYTGVVAKLVFELVNTEDDTDTSVTITTEESGAPSEEEPKVDTIPVQAEGTKDVWSEPKFTWSDDGKSVTVSVTCEKHGVHTETLNATITSTVKTPASCTDNGTTTYTATVTFGGKTYTNSKDIKDIPALKHDYQDGVCTHCGEKNPNAGDPVDPKRMLGDVNLDGKINSVDYMLLKRYVLNTFTFNEEQKLRADINQDGNIKAVDYMLLKRAVLKTYTIEQPWL